MSLLFATALAAASIEGFWEFPQGDIIKVSPCGKPEKQRMCGYSALVTTFSPGARDRLNPNHSERHRRICGLKLFSIRQSKKSGAWEGTSYSPEDGYYYIMSATLGDDEIEIHATVLLPGNGVEYSGSSSEKIFKLRRTSDPGPCENLG